MGVPIAPDNAAALKRIIAAMAQDALTAQAEIARLKFQLARYRRAEFGRSSEKLERDTEQLELALEALETDQAERLATASPALAAAVETAAEAQKPARHGERRLRCRRAPGLHPRQTTGLQLGNDLGGDFIVEARPAGTGPSASGVSGHCGSPRRAPGASLPALNPSRKARPHSHSRGVVRASPQEGRTRPQPRPQGKPFLLASHSDWHRLLWRGCDPSPVSKLRPILELF